MNLQVCRSYRVGAGICADGFPQRSLCRGLVGCLSCGAVRESELPLCLGDEVSPHLADEAGRMVLRATRAQE